jgi:hypothetical protein
MALMSPALEGVPQSFTNVATMQGLDVVPTGYFGNSVSFHDFDQDGWADVTMAVPGDSIRLYRNIEGNLLRLPSPAATPGDVKHILWVDFDNDGDDDLFFTVHNGPVALYRNDGGGVFTDITASAGLPLMSAPHFGASWGDYDRDGYLDLYVCCYASPGMQSYSELNHLYRNNGDGTFTDVTLQAGVGDGFKTSFQSLWFDHDQDGWPDLYIINDRPPFNSLYRNNGDGTFTNIAASTGTECPNTDSMSAALCDPDNDGNMDLFVTNNGTIAVPDHPCRLLMNQGNGTYTDQALDFGVACDYFGWGAVWADVDNNGWQDLFVASEGSTGNQLHLNMGTQPLLNGTAGLVDSPPITCFTVATGDLNNDGHPDFIVGSEFPNPTQLWLNAGGSAGNHAVVHLQGTASNRMAIGSWIRVYANGLVQTRYTTCGANYIGQDSPHHHFGLGPASEIDSITVSYPSGHTDSYHGLPTGATFTFIEGETYVLEPVALGPTTFCQGGSLMLDAGEHHAYLWNNGHEDRFLEVMEAGSYAVTITTVHGVQVTSDTMMVTVHPAPSVLPFPTSPSCHSSADGAIELALVTPAPIVSVVWAHGASGALLEGLTEGGYTYVVTDDNGCTTNGAVTLQAPPELLIVLATTPDNGTANGSLMVDVYGGTPPHALLLDGTPVQSPVQDLAGGEYLLAVEDLNGCQLDTLVAIGTSTGLASMANSGIRILPDPVSRLVRVEGMQDMAHWRLFDLAGRQLGNDQVVDDGVLPVPPLPPGIYILHIIGHQMELRTKLHWLY